MATGLEFANKLKTNWSKSNLAKTRHWLSTLCADRHRRGDDLGFFAEFSRDKCEAICPTADAWRNDFLQHIFLF